MVEIWGSERQRWSEGHFSPSGSVRAHAVRHVPVMLEGKITQMSLLAQAGESAVQERSSWEVSDVSGEVRETGRK